MDDNHLHELCLSDFLLGLSSGDHLGDEHFADDPAYIEERNWRINQPYEFPVPVKKSYLDFENLCNYFK